jgi:hypothetical protein
MVGIGGCEFEVLSLSFGVREATLVRERLDGDSGEGRREAREIREDGDGDGMRSCAMSVGGEEYLWK